MSAGQVRTFGIKSLTEEIRLIEVNKVRG